jgi:hypothetical protein
VVTGRVLSSGWCGNSAVERMLQRAERFRMDGRVILL